MSIRRGLVTARNPTGGTTAVSSHYFAHACPLRRRTRPCAANGTGLRCRDHRRRFFWRGHSIGPETETSRGACPDHREEPAVRSQSWRIHDGAEQLLHDATSRPNELSRTPSPGETGTANVVREPAG